MKSIYRLAPLASALALACALPAVAKEFDLATATIKDINDAIDAGALTSEKLVQLYLNRINAYDQQGPKINSLITVNPQALEIARALDEERKTKGRRSPLHGIPVVVKDLINTSDMPTTGGFIGMKGAVPQYDANVVKRLKAAGAIILAKTNEGDWLGNSRPDGGSSLAGQVINPYDLSRTVAPSSSGVGASIGAYFATAGLGSETGTSIRNPTTDSSLVGLAGTEGLVGRGGSMGYTFTHERIGPMCRDSYDLAVMLDYITGVDANDLITAKSLTHLPTASYTTFLNPNGLKGARIGVLREMFRKGEAHAEGLALANNAIFELRKAGADVYDPVSVGTNLDRIHTFKVNYWEEHAVLDKYFRDFGPNSPYQSVDDMAQKAPTLVKPEFIDYKDYTLNDPEYLSRLKSRRSLRDALVALMDKFELDALVYPYKTLPAEKLKGGGREGRGGKDEINDISRPGDRVSPSDNYLSSMTGLPGMLAPMGFTKEGDPLALEFLGRPFAEPTLLKLVSGYEAQTKHRHSPPFVPALPGEKFTY
jgi:Asp-tRNA(Asn)/Glu-tRNA(Gln) amidotransferase A subunit family amidase